MARISTNLSGIERALLNRMTEATAAAAQSALRLASGKNINSPSDDPGAFVALSGLQSQMSLASAAMSNATAAASLASGAQTALAAIRYQLEDVIRHELENLDPLHPEAAQAKIDAAIGAINTLAAAPIENRRLFDGSASFVVSGLDSSQVRELNVYSTGGGQHAIEGTVATTATRAEQVYTGDSDNEVISNAEITITGNLGSIELSVTAGQALSEVSQAVNAQSHLTGVTASVDEVAHTLTFTSVRYGTRAEVSVTAAVPGTFEVTGTGVGTDAVATINGESITGDGNTFTLNRNGFHFEMEIVGGFTGEFSTITVSGSALTFDLWGDPARRSTLALPSLLSAQLGGLSGRLDELRSGGTISIADETSQALRVVDEALGQLTRAEGLVDGFQNAAVASASDYLAGLEESLQSAIDGIDQVDEEEETQRMSFYEQLVSNGESSLMVLYQQRQGIVDMIRQIAGLS